MLDSDRVPGYPPPRNTWEFPPPEVSSGWKWLAALATVTSLLVAGALVAVLIMVGIEDFPGLIEDESLTDTIAAECTLMTLTVESLPLSGSTERQAERIIEQNRAVEIMVRSIRRANAPEVRDDAPAEQWLRDWERLVEARQTYARRLQRDPEALLVIPRDADGARITDRMDDVWLGDPVCEVPRTLSRPSTEDAADI